jgi:hypothetical protein
MKEPSYKVSNVGGFTFRQIGFDVPQSELRNTACESTTFYCNSHIRYVCLGLLSLAYPMAWRDVVS